MPPRHWLGAALAALVFTACQPSASGSPSGEPSPGASGPLGSIPSFVGNPELEATLPEEAGDIVFFQSVSMSGPDFLAGGDELGNFEDFIDTLGADVEDVSVAVALGANHDVTDTATILAFQVDGAQAADLVDAFKSGAEQGGDALVWNARTVGGKRVEVAEPNDDFPTPIGLYAIGEVLYFVSSTDPDAFEAILEQLP
jgi:hypothetical protein